MSWMSAQINCINNILEIRVEITYLDSVTLLISTSLLFTINLYNECTTFYFMQEGQYLTEPNHYNKDGVH